ncbi:DUF1501 domain-containing protein [Schlesneria paludicola]|uniref:DUF1501 domain-containing protein n=1 Tax=Schlesneria paludicola TaxID=360056 RepID=UPI00029B1A37|nr:DUF1501 domain-containing protein [Schlesneria paludicola]
MNTPSLLASTALSRRHCLKWGGLLAGTSTWPAAGLAAEANVRRPARACILVYLLGGPPHLDMFDLKPEAPVEVRGPFSPISTSVPDLQICEHLPKLAARAHRFALLRAVSHPNAHHTPMIYYTLTGRHVDQPEIDNDISPPRRTDFPNIGSIIAKRKPAPSGLPGCLAVPELGIRSNEDNIRAADPLRGGRGGFLGQAYDPFILNGDPRMAKSLPEVVLPEDVDRLRFDRRLALLSTINSRHPAGSRSSPFDLLQSTAVRLTGSPTDERLYSVDREPDRVRDRYGRHRFGQSLLLARRFVEAGVPFVSIYFNHMTRCDGWDTHGKNFEGCEQELLPIVDQGLSGLMDDLTERGLFDDVLVACYGEFGRTPKINKDAGRDHWGHCSSTWLCGGGIRGGAVFGESDALAAYPKANKVDPIDVHATLFHRLGLDPGTEIVDALSRPHAISQGRVIDAIL